MLVTCSSSNKSVSLFKAFLPQASVIDLFPLQQKSILYLEKTAAVQVRVVINLYLYIII